jgi:hypothetical protein
MSGNPPASVENREKQGFLTYFERGAVTLHQEMSGIHSNACGEPASKKANPSGLVE